MQNGWQACWALISMQTFFDWVNPSELNFTLIKSKIELMQKKLGTVCVSDMSRINKHIQRIQTRAYFLGSLGWKKDSSKVISSFF